MAFTNGGRTVEIGRGLLMSDGPGLWIVEANTLGLRPGSVWPSRVVVFNGLGSTGEAFERVRVEQDGEAIVRIVYQSHRGDRLEVIAE